MTSDKLKALRETLQREAPNALADLSMSDDEYSGVEEWSRCCPACEQRDDCEHKLLGRALVKIEILNSRIAELEEFRTKANARIHRLSDALEELMFRNEGPDCDCDPDDDYYCDYHLARLALEAKP